MLVFKSDYGQTKGRTIMINHSLVESIGPHDGGAVLRMSSKDKYIVAETFDEAVAAFVRQREMDLGGAQ